MHKTFYSQNMKYKKQFGRLRLTQNDSIKVDLKEIGCECVDWIHLIQDRDQW
jgi:hypothetical protein